MEVGWSGANALPHDDLQPDQEVNMLGCLPQPRMVDFSLSLNEFPRNRPSPCR